MKLASWPRSTRIPASRLSRAMRARRAVTEAVLKTIMQNRREAWQDAIIWSRDCPDKLRRLYGNGYPPERLARGRNSSELTPPEFRR